MTPPNHLRFIVGCLTLLAVLFGAIGGYLLLKGFQSGELFVTIAGSISGTIGGMLAMRNSGTTPPPADTSLPASPIPVDSAPAAKVS